MSEPNGEPAFHIPNMTIQFFPQTQEGQAAINSQRVFCLAGDLYQGYKGAIASVNEKSLLDDELEAVNDVDGTMDRVRQIRKARLGSREMRKNKEYQERNEVKRAQRLADLNLAKLERELGLTPESPLVAELDATPEPTAVVDTTPVECDICLKTSPSTSKNPKRWLQGHKMGAHKDKS